jgi:hypothetical protein
MKIELALARPSGRSPAPDAGLQKETAAIEVATTFYSAFSH